MNKDIENTNNKYKKGTKPKQEFNPSENAKDFIQDMANKMGVSVEDVIETIKNFSDELEKRKTK